MDRRINEKLRKPRRTKGTPFYVQRNYWAGGVILLGGVAWFLFDKSKVPASSVESLSNFFKKKTTQSETYDKNNQSIIETVEEPMEDNHSKYVDTESPYKNLIKTNTNIILNDSASDSADFKSPIHTRKQKKLIPVQKSKLKRNTSKRASQSTRGRGRPKSSAKKTTAKMFTENFQYFGENPEHIQMGIALSKSSYEAECGCSSESSSTDDISNISEILRNSKPAFLERFGFTSCRKELPVENKRLSMVSTEATKKNKNRFKYITPILNIRTCEERNSLINSKISLILCQNNSHSKKNSENVLNSNTLNIYCISRERSIFYLDDIYQKNNFYIKNLEIPRTIHECGSLLKDWDLIPGRDKSPCRRKNDSTEEKIITSKDQDPKLSFSRHCSKTLNDEQETRRESALSEAASHAQTMTNKDSPYKKSPVKHLSDTLSLGATYSFSVSTDIQETNVGSFSTESKDSAIPPSFTSSATSTVNSFNSSRTSCISPDLFGSDDEPDHQYLSETENVSTSKSYSKNVKESLENDEGMLNSLEKLHKNPVNCLKSDQIIIPNNAEIIDLTDDDEERSYKSPNMNLSRNDNFFEGNDDCINPHQKNQTKKNSKLNIYNLDEFETDDQYKMETISGNVDYFKRTLDKDIKTLDTDTVNIPEDKNSSGGIDDYETSIFPKDNYITLNNLDGESFHTDMEVANDNISLKIISKRSSFKKSSNKSVNETSLSSSSSSKGEISDNAYIILDSSDSHDGPSDLSDDELKQGSSLNNTPKGNKEYIRHPSFHNETLSDKNEIKHSIDNNEKSGLYSTINENSSLEETPKKCVGSVGSPCFDEPIFYDSTNLNVTNYVNNMLDQENFSFDKTNHLNDMECYDANDDGGMSSSQGSQSSVILDEELNYSSNFATPAKVNNMSEKRRKYIYDETQEMNEIIPISSELPDRNFETPPHRGVSVNTEILPVDETVTSDNIIIKTDNVTPMPEYEKMATPLINRELQKVGVKPLKRPRGAKLLKYIYESTHPIVESKENVLLDNSESDEDKRVIKRRKKVNNIENFNNLECDSACTVKSLISFNTYVSSIEIIGDRIVENEKLEDLIFERKQLTKIASCKVPLQIVWHNLVSSDQTIQENILLYEPLQLESLHIMLKEQGFKFHIQDLLSFLDKKCITIRTAQKRGKTHR